MKTYKKILLGVLLADGLLILSHFLWGGEAAFFNLDAERNLPTIYSGLKLLTIGGLAFFAFWAGRSGKSWIWLPFGGIFIYLGLDEMLELHEKLMDYLAEYGLTNLNWYSNQVFYWTLIFSPLIILAVGFLIYLIKYFWFRVGATRNFLVAGLFCFIVVIILEIIGGFSDGASVRYYWLTFAEEIFEIFGATMFLAAILNHMLREFEKNKTEKINEN